MQICLGPIDQLQNRHVHMPNLVGRRCAHADSGFRRMNALARPKPTSRSDEVYPGYILATRRVARSATAARAPQKEKSRTASNDSGFRRVRGGGIEPPWLLTASTSKLRLARKVA
jgi:hypothetical protein